MRLGKQVKLILRTINDSEQLGKISLPRKKLAQITESPDVLLIHDLL